MVLSPPVLSSSDQSSVLLLDRATFKAETVVDYTKAVMDILHGGSEAKSSFFCSVMRPVLRAPVASGDLIVVGVQDLAGRPYLLASFHGDTNGLATVPVLEAIHRFQGTLPDHELIFGLDANTYANESTSTQGVAGFMATVGLRGLTTCWADPLDSSRNYTTFLARTFLQPQLQKAVKRSALQQTDPPHKQVDRNPKDFILFRDGAFESVDKDATKDNTGKRRFVDDIVFPTLEFPSDHAILSARLRRSRDTGTTEM